MLIIFIIYRNNPTIKQIRIYRYAICKPLNFSNK